MSTFAVTEKRLDGSNRCVSWIYLLQVHFHSSSGLFDFLFARRQNPSLSTNQCKSWIYSLSPVVSPHSTCSPPKSMQLSPKKIAAAQKPTLFAVGPNQRGASQVSDPISPEPSSGHLHSQKTSHSLLSLSSNQCQFWTKLETLRSYTITFFQVSVPIYLSSEPSWSHFHKLHYQKNWILSSLSSV